MRWKEFQALLLIFSFTLNLSYTSMRDKKNMEMGNGKRDREWMQRKFNGFVVMIFVFLFMCIRKC